MADPYKPGSPAYAERHRETALDIGGGMVRIDIGEPISGLKKA
jgi:hypothetical protein